MQISPSQVLMARIKLCMMLIQELNQKKILPKGVSIFYARDQALIFFRRSLIYEIVIE